ncbi:MAG: hypothetical protein ABSG38_16050 [Spirochaetia bacterium]|jgi:hypothetical protein
MSNPDFTTAVEWLRSEMDRVPFGRVGLAFQMHQGKISKIFKQIEESEYASQPGSGRDTNGPGK